MPCVVSLHPKLSRPRKIKKGKKKTKKKNQDKNEIKTKQIIKPTTIDHGNQHRPDQSMSVLTDGC